MTDTLREPDGLTEDGKRAFAIVRERFAAEGFTSTGGCRAFYSPTEWANRGEQYGQGGVLVVVYDGGEMRELFDTYGDDAGPEDRLTEALGKVGMFPERGRHWHSTIYRG